MGKVAIKERYNMNKANSGLTKEDCFTIASEVKVTGPRPTDLELNSKDKSLASLLDTAKPIKGQKEFDFGD